MLETYLCFDLGTTKIKSALIDNRGNIIYADAKNTKSYIYNEKVVQSAEEYYKTILDEINEIKNKFPNQFMRVDSLICSGQMAGVCAIDKNWKIIVPWTNTIDNRANKYLKKIEDNFGKEIRISSGGVPVIAAKIKWIMEEFSTAYKEIAKFINLNTYVAGKLCNIDVNDVFIDYSVLSMSGLAKIKEGIWNKEICNALNIDENKLPSIKKPYEIIGYINKKIYKTNNSIKVLVGVGDQVAGFIGSGIVQKGDIIDVSGTYTTLGYCTDKAIMDFKEKIFSTINSGIEGIYYHLAVAAIGGFIYKWFLDRFNYKNYKDLKKIKKSKGLFFIPHIGGRSSPSQSYYQGTWYGIKWEHNLDSFYISIIESLGYEFSILLDKIQKLNKLKKISIKDIKVIGGGSKDILWNMIKSNILNLNYEVMYDKPYEILGSFLIAKYKEKIVNGVENLKQNKIIEIQKIVKPYKKYVEYYESLKNDYVKIVNKIGQVYREV